MFKISQIFLLFFLPSLYYNHTIKFRKDINMNSIKSFLSKNLFGMLICFLITLPAWFLGKRFPIIGGPVIAIIAGMIITLFWNDKGRADSGIKFTSKYILQAAVVFLGFGLNFSVVLQTGRQALHMHDIHRTYNCLYFT